MITTENEVVSFTDEEIRNMLRFIIGYTSEEISDKYKKLREVLVEEVLLETGKDLRKWKIWI